MLAEPALRRRTSAWALDQAGPPDPFHVAVFAPLCVTPQRATAHDRIMAPWVAERVDDPTAGMTALPFFDDLAALHRDRGVDGVRRMPDDWWAELGPIGTLDDAAAHLARAGGCGRAQHRPVPGPRGRRRAGPGRRRPRPREPLTRITDREGPAWPAGSPRSSSTATTRPVGAFWAAVLGYDVVDPSDGPKSAGAGRLGPDRAGRPYAGPAEDAKSRLHLDVNPTDRDQDAEVERILALGATLADVGQGEEDLGGAGRPGGQRVLRAAVAGRAAGLTATARRTRAPIVMTGARVVLLEGHIAGIRTWSMM